MPAERGPSGTGHDTARCPSCGLGLDGCGLDDCPLTAADPPVAVPGPASEPICPGPHGNGCDCKHNGADPHCPWVPGPASVSPADTRGYVGPVAHEITFDAQREPMFQDEHGNGWVPLATYEERCDERDALLAVGERDKAEIGRMRVILDDLCDWAQHVEAPSGDRIHFIVEEAAAALAGKSPGERDKAEIEAGQWNADAIADVHGLRDKLASWVLAGEGEMVSLPDVLNELCRILEPTIPSAGERDRRQIARLTEAIELAVEKIEYAQETATGWLTYRGAMQDALTYLRAVLVGEEDAG